MKLLDITKRVLQKTPMSPLAIKGYRSSSMRISTLEPDQSSQASMAVATNRSLRGDRRFYRNLITDEPQSPLQGYGSLSKAHFKI